ncbi:MAG: hypothetical protein JO047_10365 [Alphaproteobacteria bacterium]|nr:hypothetical protein [Alphaproteobacteria bacterium]
MSFAAVSAEEIRAAQVFTGGTFALWLAVGYLPAVRRYAAQIRAVLLVVYLVGFVGFVAYALLG